MEHGNRNLTILLRFQIFRKASQQKKDYRSGDGNMPQIRSVILFACMDVCA